MRSPAIVVALALTLTTIPAAPAAAQSGITIFGGLVSAKLSGDDTEILESKVGFAAGLGLNRAMSDGLSFNPEIMYVSKGYKDELMYVTNGSEEEAGDGDLKFNLNYIEVPLMLRYNFSSGGQAKPFITAGPTVAYQVSCKFKYSDESQSCDDVFSEDDGPRKFDFGAAFGAGVTFSRITAAARYDLGLANLSRGSKDTIHNRAFLIIIGFGF